MKWFFKCLKQYADFKGRARRREYVMFFLFQALLIGVLALLTGVLLFLLASSEATPRVWLIVFGLSYLPLLLPSLAVTVRRLHDVGKSGWVLLVPNGLFFLAGLLLTWVGLDTVIDSFFGGGGPESVIVMICLAIFVFLLWFGAMLSTRDSQPGTNKYGSNPKEVEAQE